MIITEYTILEEKAPVTEKKESVLYNIKTFFPDFSDKHPSVFSNSLYRIALDKAQELVASRLALDKKIQKNKISVEL